MLWVIPKFENSHFTNFKNFSEIHEYPVLYDFYQTERILFCTLLSFDTSKYCVFTRCKPKIHLLIITQELINNQSRSTVPSSRELMQLGISQSQHSLIEVLHQNDQSVVVCQ